MARPQDHNVGAPKGLHEAGKKTDLQVQSVGAGYGPSIGVGGGHGARSASDPAAARAVQQMFDKIMAKRLKGAN